MQRRVDVDEGLPPIAVPAPVLHELYQHARESLPEECCGLILGTAAERFGRLHRCRNVMTKLHLEDPVAHPRDGRSAFWMNELDYLRARDLADAAGERVTAVYHSHVGADCYLSAMDLEYADQPLFPFPDAAQIVVAVVDGRVGACGLFEREAPAGAFVGRRVESAGP